MVNKRVVEIDKRSTDDAGNVIFRNLAPGKYFLWEELDECWVPTTPGKYIKNGYIIPVKLFDGHQAVVKVGNVDKCGPGPGPGDEPGSITIIKRALPADDTVFTFAGDLGRFDLQDPSHNSETFSDREPGEYEVTEIVPPDWTLVGVVCSGGETTPINDGVSIDLGSNDDVTCIFKNLQKTVETPRIDIEKLTNGEDADQPTGPVIPVDDTVTWTYEVENTGNVDLTNVTVVDDNGTPDDTQDDFVCVIGDLAAGAFDDTSCVQNDTAVEGQYENVGTVTGTYNGQGVSDDDPSHYLGVIPAEPGSITVIKVVEGAVPDSEWSFNGTGDIGDFTLPAAGGSAPPFDLAAGEYTIAETQQDGYTASVSCGDNGPSGTDSVTVDLGAGADVICTFTNTEIPAEPGSITVIKVVEGAVPDSEWSFNGTGDIGDFTLPAAGGSAPPFDLAAGEYTIAETQQDGYTASVSCGDNGPSGTDSVTVDLGAGADVICTFTNTSTAEPSIAIAKGPDGNPDEDLMFVIENNPADFTIRVTNDGDVDLIDVVVTDPLVSNCNHDIGNLAVGDFFEYDCSTEDPVFDDFTNVAEVFGRDEAGNEVEATDSVDVDVSAG